MNILIGNDYGLTGGGTEKRLSLLLNKLVQLPQINKIYFLFSSDLTDIKIEKVIPLKVSNDRESRRVLDKIFSEDKIDFAQFHNLCIYNALPIYQAKRRKIPVIWFAHDYWGFCGKRNLIYKDNKVCSGFNLLKCVKCIGLKSTCHILKIKSILNLVDVGVGVSDFIIKSYEKENILKNKWVKLEPWIDLDNMPSPDNLVKEESVFYTGPLAWHKGIFDLLNAFILTLKIYPNLILKIAGPDQKKDHPHYIRFKEEIKKLNLENKIKFLGYLKTKELYLEIKKSLIFVSPSVWPEPFGLNWLEALLCEIPVIAASVGGIPEYANNKVVLVQPENPDLLSKAMIGALRGEIKLNIKENAQYVRDNFNVEKALNKLLEIYKQLEQ